MTQTEPKRHVDEWIPRLQGALMMLKYLKQVHEDPSKAQQWPEIPALDRLLNVLGASPESLNVKGKTLKRGMAQSSPEAGARKLRRNGPANCVREAILKVSGPTFIPWDILEVLKADGIPITLKQVTATLYKLGVEKGEVIEQIRAGKGGVPPEYRKR